MDSCAHPFAGLMSEKHFEALISGARDYAIYLLDVAGYVSSWNAGAQRFTGYSPEEVIGQHFSLFYIDDDRATGLPQRALDIALREGTFEQEGWRVRKVGTRFWASVVINPVRDEYGAHIGFVKITRDITERKLSQEALRQSEERFRLLVQGVTDYALCILSPEGVVTNWNSGAERIKGYKEPEIVGQHFSCFYTTDDQNNGMPAATLNRALKEGRSEQEGWRVRKDGSRFWAQVVVDAIRNEAGDLVGYAKITRDISERKNSVDALERANAELHQAQKMEAFGQLTGEIAHDFNNLLAVMSSGIEFLMTQQPNHLSLKMLDSMRRTVDHGATLSRQLLSFARQRPLEPGHFELTSVIERFEPVLRHAAPSSVDLRIEASSSVRPVRVDVARFETALLNLVVNARDALSGPGSIRVQVNDVDLSTDGQIGTLPAGQYVQVSVIDTGCGMSPDVAKRVWEPFFTTKDPEKGTGLGLSQVYGFITQSCGEVCIESEPGAGTTVSLYLPVAGGNVDERSSVPEPTSETALSVLDEGDSSCDGGNSSEASTARS
ncbi:hybrid sensor histidine kinase/response regulator [Caballeronia glathei]|uniref:hybrid sensor histidine kinase/response regulator n=1 Tax=Caballeronia glathei TaxID=60547 RepID=UPI000690833E|nr:PAS domain-containing sensor histidine kinase [Caballeronia glathei]